MDPIHPWLDPIEVRRLAERLVQTAAGSSVEQAADAGFGEHFEGFAGAASEPMVPAPTLVAAEPAMAEPPTPAPAVLATPSPPPENSAPVPCVSAADPATNAATADGRFLERVILFRNWMVSQFGTRGIFILDCDGAVIFDDGSHGKLHFLARGLAQAARRPGGSPGNVHVKVGAEAILEVIPLDAPAGRVVLGTVVPQALSPAAVSAITKALEQVTATPES